MLIRNVKSRQDLENRKKLQAEILQTQIDNEALLEQRVSDYKNPNKPPPVPIQYMTNAEKQADSLLQQKEAIDNLRSLNLEFAIASQVVQDLGKLRDGEANIIKLNKNFPFIKKDLTERFNVRQIDAQTIVEYLKDFFADVDTAIGINLAGTSSTNFFDRGARAGQSIIPTAEDYNQLESLLLKVNEDFDLNTDEIMQIVERLVILSDITSTKAELDSIDTFDVVKRQRLNKQIQRLVQKPNYIPTSTVLEQIINKIKELAQNGLTPEAQAGAQAQGIPIEGKFLAPANLQFALATLKKIIGIVGDKGIQSLTDLKNDIGSELQNTREIQAGFRRVDVPADFPEPLALLADRTALNEAEKKAFDESKKTKLELERLKKEDNERKEAKKKTRVIDNEAYIINIIKELSITKLKERILSPKNIAIYEDKYTNESPRLDDGGLYIEEIEKTGEPIKGVSEDIDGNTVKRPPNLENYLTYTRKVVKKDKKKKLKQ
jgi:hypothetical protein